MDFVNFEQWQNEYESNAACHGLHKHTLSWFCLHCMKQIDIDTDADITVSSLVCDNCKDLPILTNVAAKSLHNLHIILMKHVKL